MFDYDWSNPSVYFKILVAVNFLNYLVNCLLSPLHAAYLYSNSFVAL